MKIPEIDIVALQFIIRDIIISRGGYTDVNIIGSYDPLSAEDRQVDYKIIRYHYKSTDHPSWTRQPIDMIISWPDIREYKLDKVIGNN